MKANVTPLNKELHVKLGVHCFPCSKTPCSVYGFCNTEDVHTGVQFPFLLQTSRCYLAVTTMQDNENLTRQTNNPALIEPCRKNLLKIVCHFLASYRCSKCSSLHFFSRLVLREWCCSPPYGSCFVFWSPEMVLCRQRWWYSSLFKLLVTKVCLHFVLGCFRLRGDDI